MLFEYFQKICQGLDPGISGVFPRAEQGIVDIGEPGTFEMIDVHLTPVAIFPKIYFCGQLIS